MILAHYEEMNQNAWLQGFYTECALSAIIGNLFRSKNSDLITYPNEPINIFCDKKEQDTSPEEKEQTFRDLMCSMY